MLDLHNAIAMASTSLLLRVSKRYMVDPPERLIGQVIALFAIIFVALEPYPQQHASSKEPVSNGQQNMEPVDKLS